MKDTNGAGDTFVGGFFAALASGKKLHDAVAEGQELAALVVQNSGVQFNKVEEPRNKQLERKWSDKEEVQDSDEIPEPLVGKIKRL